MSAGTTIHFQPVVTLTEQHDGSYLADVDWGSSVIAANSAEGEELDYQTDPQALAASDALDIFLRGRPAFRGFAVPKAPR